MDKTKSQSLESQVREEPSETGLKLGLMVKNGLRYPRINYS